MKITLEQLRERIPCQEEYESVAIDWPDGIPVSPPYLYQAFNTNCGGNTQTICDLIDLAPDAEKEKFLAEYERQWGEYHEHCEAMDLLLARKQSYCDRSKNRDFRRHVLNKTYGEIHFEVEGEFETFKMNITRELAKALNAKGKRVSEYKYNIGTIELLKITLTINLVNKALKDAEEGFSADDVDAKNAALQRICDGLREAKDVIEEGDE